MFESVALYGSDSYSPAAGVSLPVSLDLHGSGGGEPDRGDKWLGTFAAGAYPAGVGHDTDTSVRWAVQQYAQVFVSVKPWDYAQTASGSPRDSLHMGQVRADGLAYLSTHRRMRGILADVEARYPGLSRTKRYISGGSKGAWGALAFLTHAPELFAAGYLDRPRWFTDNSKAATRFNTWATGEVAYPLGTSPQVVAADGGGTVESHLNAIAYVANPANPFPWIGWVIGRQDGYTHFDEHIAAMDALEASGRGYAVAWNNGNHSGQPELGATIEPSYPRGMFEVGVGYPVYRNDSGAQDPRVAISGGRYLGYSHRGVVETPTSWTCEVTNRLGARTVTVFPRSAVFAGAVLPQTISIPAANAWVRVTFMA
jgi:hypothetical protein